MHYNTIHELAREQEKSCNLNLIVALPDYRVRDTIARFEPSKIRSRKKLPNYRDTFPVMTYLYLSLVTLSLISVQQDSLLNINIQNAISGSVNRISLFFNFLISDQ